MADLARLTIQVDSVDAVTAKTRLDEMATAAANAQAAVEKLKADSGKSASVINKLDGSKIGAIGNLTRKTAGSFDLITRNVVAARSGMDRFLTSLDSVSTGLRTLDGSKLGTISKLTRATAGGFDLISRNVVATRAGMDRFTNSLGKVENGLKKVEKAQDRVVSGGRRGATAWRRWTDAGGSLVKVMKNAFVAIAPFFALFASIRSITSGIKALANFEFAMKQVKGVALETRDSLSDVQKAAQFTQLSNQARELGAATRFTATEVAEGQLFLARAGFEANEIFEATPAVLDLAAAGVLDLARAADIASNVLQQFNLDVSELTRVVDVMVKVASNANTTVEQMAEAFKIAGPVAGSLGISIETTAAAIGLLGNAGIQATLAGTQLRGIFAALADPTREAGQLMEQLARASGLSGDAFDLFSANLSDTEDPLIRVLRNLNEAGAGVEDFFRIFGRRQASGAIVLSVFAEELDRLKRSAEDAAGTADTLASIMEDTLIGAAKELVAAWQDIFVSSGLLRDSLTTITNFLTEFVRGLTGATAATEDFNVAARALAVALKVVAASAITVGISKLWESLGKLTVNAYAATRATSVLGIATTKLGSGMSRLFGIMRAHPIITLITVAYGLVEVFGLIEDSADRAAEANDAFSDSLQRLESQVSSAESSYKALIAQVGRQDFDKANESVRRLVQEISGISDTVEAVARNNNGKVPLGVFFESDLFKDEAKTQADLLAGLYGQFFADSVSRQNLTQAILSGTSAQEDEQLVRAFVQKQFRGIGEEFGVTFSESAFEKLDLSKLEDRILAGFKNPAPGLFEQTISEIAAEMVGVHENLIAISKEDAFGIMRSRAAAFVKIAADLNNKQRDFNRLLLENEERAEKTADQMRDLQFGIDQVFKRRDSASADAISRNILAGVDEQIEFLRDKIGGVQPDIAELERELAQLAPELAADFKKQRELGLAIDIGLEIQNLEEKKADIERKAKEAVEAARIEDFGDGIGDSIGDAAAQMVVDFENATETVRNLFQRLAADILDFLLFDQLSQEIGLSIKNALQQSPTGPQGPPSELAGPVAGAFDPANGPLPGLGGDLSVAALSFETSAPQLTAAATGFTTAAPAWAGIASTLQSAATTLLIARAGSAGAVPGAGLARGGIMEGGSSGVYSNSIVNKPTVMGNNLVGEGTRSEAVMPLDRTTQGGLGVFARVNDGFGVRSTTVPVDRLSNGMLGVNIAMPRGGSQMPRAMGPVGSSTTNNNTTVNNYYNVTVKGDTRDSKGARRTGNQVMRAIARRTS